jgi:hypothetical protein
VPRPAVGPEEHIKYGKELIEIAVVVLSQGGVVQTMELRTVQQWLPAPKSDSKVHV